MLTGSEVAALIMAAVAVGGMIVQYKKVRPERETSAIDALSKLLEDFTQLREQLEVSKDQEEDCQARLATARAEAARLTEQLMEVKSHVARAATDMPMMIAAKKIAQMSHSLRRVFNASRDGIVITADGGRFLYVNDAFARALGRAPEEVLAMDYRAMVHPEDAEATISAERDAWSHGGVIDNRYRHVNGSWVKLRWHFENISDGAAFSVVWFDRRRESGATAAISTQ